MDNRNSFLSLRGLGGEMLAEFLGTLVLVLFGDGVVATVLLFQGFSGATTGGTSSWMLINFGWGFAVMLGIYVAGTLTGAHLNPAVTLAMALRRGLGWGKVIPYWIAQVAGAFVGALLVFLLFHDGFFKNGNLVTTGTDVFDTGPHTALQSGLPVSYGAAFFAEVLGTVALVFLILAIVDNLNSPPGSNLAPLLIGLLIVAIGMSLGTVSGYAINPARDFGPRLFSWIAGWPTSGYFWVPIVGPLLGGAIGAYLYDFTIHRTLEARAAAADTKK